MPYRAMVLLMCVSGSLCAVGAPPGGMDTLVLDESAYWRYCVQFGMDRLDAAALKKEGEAILGKDGLARLRRQVARWRRPPYVDEARARQAPPADWRDEAPFFVTQVANVGCNDERVSFHTHSPPPPPGWMQADFPDAAWQRQRLPLLVGEIPTRGTGHGVGEMRQPLVRGAYYRTTFEAPKPPGAGRYTLSLTFRGGVRVFVNGTEVARSHLPAGAVGPDTPAESYPRQAYVCLDGEADARWVAKTTKRTGGDFVPFCPDLVGQMEKVFVDFRGRRTEHYGGIVNRAGWKRIRALRDRRLGPVAIPAGVLRPGRNVLAVEVRSARLHPVVAAGKGMNWGTSYYMGARFGWAHCRLLRLALRSSAASAPSALTRPAGVCLWVEDVHRRLYAPDFGPRQPGQAVRIVAPVNGTCAGQIALSADRELTGLAASASALKADGGSAQIPAGAVRIAWLAGHPVSGMVKLGHWRGLPEIVKNPVCPTSWMGLLRHGPPAVRQSPPPRAEVVKLMDGLDFFDHIAPRPPRRLPAGRCQPIWISLRVPPNAKPGTYRGSVTVSAAGMKPAAVAVVAEVVPWHVPDPRHFQAFFAGEQCPYGVAERYKVPLWSDEHFRRMEASFRQLARLGCSWVFVPVIQYSEFGNLRDSMVKWFRRKPRTPAEQADGGLSLDLSILDRYLALARRHLGRPKVICFVVSHGTAAGAPATMDVTDVATGKVETLDLSPRSPDYRRRWRALSTTLYEHLAAKGMGESLYWGYGWDGIGDADLIPMLAEFVPEAVRWARGSHAPNRAPGGWSRAFTASSFIYGVPITEDSRQGWRQPTLPLLNPRAGCSVVSANGHSPPFAYRMLMDRAVAAGCRGLARIGADYWEGVFYRGYEGRAWAGSLPGMGCLQLLWPGADGAEPGQRQQMLLEGIQETEARIFIEQALSRSRLSGDLAGRAREALTRHYRDTLYFPVGRIGIQIQEYSGDWQRRSKRLYRMAAEVAQAVPLDLDRTEIARTAPARARRRVELTIRNWTGQPRPWKVASDAAWLVPQRRAGTLLGHETLPVTINAAALAPGQTAEGKLTVTDLASGRDHAVKVTARIGEVFRFVVPAAYDYLGSPAHASSWGPRRIGQFATFNVPAGGSESRQFVFTNLCGVELPWRISSPAGWVKVSPSSGRLPAGGRVNVTLTAAPPLRQAARHEVVLEVSEAAPGGAAQRARQQARLIVHVLPAYRPPDRPRGAGVPLASVPKAKIKAHRSRAYWYGTSSRGRDDYGPKFDEKANLSGGTPQFTIYDIDGAGFAAFSATVKVLGGRKRVREGNGRKKVNFEVWVDGRLAAQSGLVTAAAGPRLLVADLTGAKRLKLHVRWDRPEAKYLGGTIGTAWLAPTLHKAR